MVSAVYALPAVASRHAHHDFALDAGLDRPTLFEDLAGLADGALIHAGEGRAGEAKRLILRRHGEGHLPPGQAIGAVSRHAVVNGELHLVGVGFRQALGRIGEEIEHGVLAPRLGNTVGEFGDLLGVHGHSPSIIDRGGSLPSLTAGASEGSVAFSQEPRRVAESSRSRSLSSRPSPSTGRPARLLDGERMVGADAELRDAEALDQESERVGVIDQRVVDRAAAPVRPAIRRYLFASSGILFQPCMRRGRTRPNTPPPWLKAMRSLGCRPRMPPIISEAMPRLSRTGKATSAGMLGRPDQPIRAGRMQGVDEDRRAQLFGRLEERLVAPDRRSTRR